jgi:hypothetical protein
MESASHRISLLEALAFTSSRARLLSTKVREVRVSESQRAVLARKTFAHEDGT